MPKMKYPHLHKEVEDAVENKISFGQKFRAPDLRKMISNPKLTGADVAYGLSRMNRYGKVHIVGYEPSDKVPAGHLRIYEKTTVPERTIVSLEDIFGDNKVKEDEVNTLVKSRLDWTRLDTIYPSRMTNLIEEHGIFGVYQVVRTEHKTDELISPNIGYIGQSRSIFGRVWCLKANKHNACNYIKHNNIPYSDIWVRFLFTDLENRGKLERLLHDRMKEAHGYIYQWREASAGTDGSMLRLYEMIDKISSREDAESVYSYARQRCVDLYLENLGNEIEKE